MKMLAEKDKCCGCAACYSVCPASCIVMLPDMAGFLYPHIQKDNCIECGLCSIVCPVLNPVTRNTTISGAYIVQHTDDKIRMQSTSGGAFTAIAQFVIEKGGIVFGATFDDELQVHHTYVESIDDLKKYRSSKYVQSTIGDAFLQAKEFLENGRAVCFSGTPCQICGLKSFLGHDYENLLTVDFMCRSVPSPLIYSKYLQLQKEILGDIERLRFRDKCFGYSYSTMTIEAKKNNKFIKYHRGIESDLWLRAYFSRVCDRPCCKDCQFQTGVHQSDYTIWDCVNVWKYAPAWDDNIGSNRLLIQSKKGRECFDEIKKSLRVMEVSSDKIIDKISTRSREVPNIDRNRFYKDAHEMDTFIFFNKYFPYTAKIRLLHIARFVSYRMKIYRILKRHVWDRLRK